MNASFPMWKTQLENANQTLLCARPAWSPTAALANKRVTNNNRESGISTI